jgi:Family of unknown function (DUF7009)
MKLRIKGNSLRLRITRPELDQLMRNARIEESISFAPGDASRLTYSLEHIATTPSPTVSFQPPSLAVILPTAQAQQWAAGEDIGIYAAITLDPGSSLDLIVEKDFACLHGSADENRDAFPNPDDAV